MSHVIIFGGPNGSGKSTLYDQYSEESKEGVLYINADIIAKEITQNNPNNLTKPEIDMMASQLAQKKLVECIESEDLVRGVMYETVMSHISKVEYLAKANEYNHNSRLVYIATDDPEINVRRVAHRVENNGHPVPIDKIRSRYHRSMNEMLPLAMEIADKSRIYDNTKESTSPILIVIVYKDLHAFEVKNNPPNWVLEKVIRVLNDERYSVIIHPRVEEKYIRAIYDILDVDFDEVEKEISSS